MSHKEEISPEEKLLNLIRRPDKKPSKQKLSDRSIVLKSDLHSKVSTFLPDHKNSFSKEKKTIFAGFKFLNFVLINRLILLAVFIFSVLLFIDLFLRYPNLSKFQSHTKDYLKTIPQKEEIKPYEYYSQEISKRALFNAESTESKVEKVIPAGQTFKELIRGLKLLGVVSGDNPQVIIEDQKLQKTYFLYPGDYLGEIKIEEVYSDRVILEFKGERISLFL